MITCDDRLLSPPSTLLDDIHPDTLPYKHATVTEGGQEYCSEGAMIDNSRRHPAVCSSPTEQTGTCWCDVTQRDDVTTGVCPSRQDGDDLSLSSLSSDDNSSDVTLSESFGDEHDGIDDDNDADADDADDDDDDDADDSATAGYNTSVDWLAQDTVRAATDNITFSSALQTSNVTQQKSVGRELCDIATQTDLGCLADQRPASSQWQQRLAGDQQSRNNGRCNDEVRSSSAPYDLEQAGSSNRRTVSPNVQLVFVSESVNELETTLRVSAVSGEPGDALADHNVATRTGDNQQQQDLKNGDETSHETSHEITEGDVAEQPSAFSDHDHLSVIDSKVRGRLEDGSPGHVMKYGDASWDESMTQKASDANTEPHALFETCNGCTWHADCDRNTRIWKLLVSETAADRHSDLSINTNYPI